MPFNGEDRVSFLLADAGPYEYSVYSFLAQQGEE